jgi:tRNA G18 (ribose-2'-O)-methylase SpoU
MGLPSFKRQWPVIGASGTIPEMTSTRARRAARALALERYWRQRRVNFLASPGPSELIVVLDHLKPNFNVAKIFRSAQAFGARELHLIDIGPFDPAPAKGGLKNVPARFLDDISESVTLLREERYQLFALVPDLGAPLHRFQLPLRSAFIVGHEEFGLSFHPTDYPEIAPAHIPLPGPTQSLNVSVAASLAMYEYTRQHSIG